MTIFDRLSRAREAFTRNPVDLKRVSNDIDAMIASKQLAVGPVTSEKERSSRLDIRHNDNDLAYAQMYGMLHNWAKVNIKNSKWYKKEPPREDPSRDDFLSEIWREEPILAGAVYSMTAKMMSLKWAITGKRRNATAYAKLLARSAHMSGYDWGGFISATSEDFFTTNKGVFWELAKTGDPLFSPMQDLGHIDSIQCTLTGNSAYPVTYVGYHTGQVIRFQPGEYIHFNSMSSPRERYIGNGFCAVDRALRGAKLLLGLHDYDDEKLANLPPEGVAAVTGLTMSEFQDAIKLWMAKRESDNSLTFPQVLWLIGSEPNAKVGVDFSQFSTLPESFNRKDVVEQYVNTVALAMGVDAREFWTYSGGGLGGGTAGESEIQHLKAKGKGPGEFISTVERSINGEMPDDTDFQFDTQDIEEDANAAAVAKAWIDAYFVLYNLPQSETEKKTSDAADKADAPFASGAKEYDEYKAKGNPRPDKPNGAPTSPTSMIAGVQTGGKLSSNNPAGPGASGGQPKGGIPGGLGGGSSQKIAEQVITKDQFMRILADKGVLPDWMVNDDRVVIEDTDIHNQGFKSYGHAEDETRITWSKGILKEERVPGSIAIVSHPNTAAVPYALMPTTYEKSLSNASFEQAFEYLKEKRTDILGDNRAIHGEPIPEAESTRGSKPSRRTIHDELELWRSHPILSQYAMTAEEENDKFGAL